MILKMERLKIKFGDITNEDTDAIVNAANWTLLGGGGVDGAIHDAGGSRILEECKEIRRTQYPNGLSTGEAVITTGGKLPAKYVIHTVGPIYGRNNGHDSDLLEACYRNCVRVAVENDITSIAFPSISTGAFGYPKHEAASIVYRTLTALLIQYPSIEIRLVFFSEADSKQFLKHAERSKSQA